MEEEEGEDQRREVALTATLLLQPDPKFSKVTQAQLDKLRELNRRRLQLKERSKAKTKHKGNAIMDEKATKMDLGSRDTEDTHSIVTLEDSSLSTEKGKASLDEVVPTLISQKRRKLHWGLDTKERWERKANM